MKNTAKQVVQPYVSAAEDVLKKYRDNGHFMEGGHGVSCFVWINGSVFSSENSLRLNGNVESDLRKLPGVYSVKINID